MTAVADERELGQRVREAYLAQLDRDVAEPLIGEVLSREAPLLDPAAIDRLRRRVEADVGGLGPLDELWDDPTITDVLANGAGPVWVERGGRLERTPVIVDADQLGRIVERTMGRLGVRIDRACPIADGRLDDGSRISVVLPPVAIEGPLISIRRFTVHDVALDAFAAPPVVELLDSLVESGANLVVYGGTGSGKTTLLNALARRLPASERVITVEDAAELDLGGEHVVRLEARVANAEGAGRVALGDLVRAALRMRPDRIVVGEVRGAEALDMVWAMSTGHDGSMSTVHASGPVDALLRLETFVAMAPVTLTPATIRSQLVSAIDALVGLERVVGGGRRVVSVHELAPVGDPPAVRELVRGDRVLGPPIRPARRSR